MLIGARPRCAEAAAQSEFVGRFGFLSRARSESSSAVSGAASCATSKAAYCARKASLRARLKRLLRQPHSLPEAQRHGVFWRALLRKDAKDAKDARQHPRRDDDAWRHNRSASRQWP